MKKTIPLFLLIFANISFSQDRYPYPMIPDGTCLNTISGTFSRVSDIPMPDLCIGKANNGRISAWLLPVQHWSIRPIIKLRDLSGRTVRAYRNGYGITVRSMGAVSYTHLRAHESVLDLVC